MKFLFKVEDVFDITGRGIVLVPGLSGDDEVPVVRIGDPLVLRLPSGLSIQTKLAAFEMVNYHTKPRRVCLPISLPKEIKKGDIPIGTEVFLDQK